MSGADERMVANPYLHALDRLATRAENAVDGTPNIDHPTESIGDGPAWTGSTARQVHEDHLAPHAAAVRSALRHLVEDIEQRRSEFDPTVPESIAEVIRIELENR
ncbi:hypothetical protein [Phytoactinopolyspora limicola]|uniref:hypothetical protein n=1 Tax=Phytoactinopolyspora limicola TaxID=2715536 RepID=UPI00140AAF3A|nr:hypothetical protein [Phytoactinopolyspora limicola]